MYILFWDSEFILYYLGYITGSEASENRALRELLLLISANEPEVATWTGLVSNLFLGLLSCLLFSTIVCLRCSTFDVFIWSCAGMVCYGV